MTVAMQLSVTCRMLQPSRCHLFFCCRSISYTRSKTIVLVVLFGRPLGLYKKIPCQYSGLQGSLEFVLTP